jgi:hypothetical protein
MTSRPADVVFSEGPVLSGTGERVPDGTVAVRDGRIVATGSAAAGLAGPGTERVSLRGKLLIPGFGDAHVHAVSGGLELGQCDLSQVTDPRECLDTIVAYAAAHPDREWITGGGWSLESFPGGLPTAERLDQAVPDRPVFLLNRDHHGAWVNSRALDRARITAETPDPPGGRIERDSTGAPSGMLQEGAVDLVGALVPRPTEAELDEALLRAQRMLHSFGVTAWQDALVGEGLGLADNYGAYRRAASSGALTARVRGALWWDRDQGAEQIPRLAERRAAGRIGRFDPGTVKIMQDGIIENGTAALLGPYRDPCGRPTGGAGMSFVDPELLPAYVTELDRLGFQVHFHSLGDRAVREALDALEAARAANGPDRGTGRHLLAHLQVVHPDDVPRFATLGAVANIQPLWACHEPQMDDFAIPMLGPERSRWQYPFADLLRSGAAVAAGSDWPVSSANPLEGIEVAVTRVAPGRSAESFLPGQRLELAAALRAYTAGSAWACHLDETGVIRAGSLADLALLDRDPFAGPPGEIAATTVLATYVEGRQVYGR